ncbi:MAG TPA: hypothetical protein VFX21_03950 [Acidimicrobiia bacterium]|nr:hypothetical protein [Acidimicrobiia bacterium]
MRFRRGAAVLVSMVLGAGLLTACKVIPQVAPQATGCSPLAVPSQEPATVEAPSAPAVPPDDRVNVAVELSTGAPNLDLTGVVWNSGSSIEPLAAAHPSIVRIDGSLQSRSQGPDQLDLQPLLDRVAQVRDIGAEPLVLLSYMPSWLGAPRATNGQDPTRMAPYDLDLWQDLVTEVVRTLATAEKPAYRFETWNEPDLPIFWQDTRESFIATALRSHQAVVDVAAETGLPLEIGGPASFHGGSTLLPEYARAVADAGLPLDFVTWHNYANFPFLGPDGPEGNLDPEIYAGLAKRNPNSTPLTYSNEIRDVRKKIKTAVGDSGLSPELIIDEWNVSAGGYDVRHDTAEGASLIAGILVEMERAGLDEAAFYRAVSGSHIGDWGLVYSDGTPKPSWWVFRAWSTMTGDRLFAAGDDATTGLWARATRDGGCVSVLLANFIATGAPARNVEVNLHGELPPCQGQRTTTLATLDATSTNLADTATLHPANSDAITVPMASQSVSLIRISCGR